MEDVASPTSAAGLRIEAHRRAVKYLARELKSPKQIKTPPQLAPYIPAPKPKRSAKKNWFEFLKERPVVLRQNYQLGFETRLIRK